MAPSGYLLTLLVGDEARGQRFRDSQAEDALQLWRKYSGREASWACLGYPPMGCHCPEHAVPGS